MDYELVPAEKKDIDQLIEYQLSSVLDFAIDLSDDEIHKIKSYVKQQIPIQLKRYKMIKVANKKIGCLLVEKKQNGILLDEIYIEQDYRGYGIGTKIIRNILQNQIVYLWVYKLNTKAIALYTKLGFHIIKQTDTRYYMKYYPLSHNWQMVKNVK